MSSGPEIGALREMLAVLLDETRQARAAAEFGGKQLWSWDELGERYALAGQSVRRAAIEAGLVGRGQRGVNGRVARDVVSRLDEHMRARLCSAPEVAA